MLKCFPLSPATVQGSTEGCPASRQQCEKGQVNHGYHLRCADGRIALEVHGVKKLKSWFPPHCSAGIPRLHALITLCLSIRGPLLSTPPKAEGWWEGTVTLADACDYHKTALSIWLKPGSILSFQYVLLVIQDSLPLASTCRLKNRA